VLHRSESRTDAGPLLSHVRGSTPSPAPSHSAEGGMCVRYNRRPQASGSAAKTLLATGL